MGSDRTQKIFREGGFTAFTDLARRPAQAAQCLMGFSKRGRDVHGPAGGTPALLPTESQRYDLAGTIRVIGGSHVKHNRRYFSRGDSYIEFACGVISGSHVKRNRRNFCMR